MKGTRCLLILCILLLSVICIGCGAAVHVAATSMKAKQHMDREATTEAPVDVVWQAAQDAVQELGIVVEGKKFSENKGEIGGRIGQLDYIRVYVWQLAPGSTTVGIQARTALLPATSKGYDLAYADKIMRTIKSQLQLTKHAPEPSTSFQSAKKTELPSPLGVPIEIAKYLSPTGQTATYQFQITWTPKGKKQVSGQLVTKTLEKRIMNGKQVIPYTREQTTFNTGKKLSSLEYAIMDETGYYKYAEQTEEMVEAKVLDSPRYILRAPLALNASWQQEGSTSLMRTKISVPFVVVVEKIDDVITVPAGTFENCLRLKYSCEVTNSKDQRIEVEGYDWHAPGVGCVKSIHKEKSSDPVVGDGGTMTLQLSSIQK